MKVRIIPSKIRDRRNPRHLTFLHTQAGPEINAATAFVTARQVFMMNAIRI
jgi:hypothetical protein